ncbi:type II toxin-antitoxin system VapC family toxin [Spirosoma luteolum]
MRYLIDTHILLWMLEGDNRLSSSALTILQNRANKLLVSAASLFEIAIKAKLGKLDTQRTTTEIVAEMSRLDMLLLPVLPSHLDTYQTVPLFDDHRDPFDRLLIATALCEQVSFISSDGKFDRYTPQLTLIR